MKKIISLLDVNDSVQVSNDDPASLKLKILNDKILMELPSAIDAIYVPPGTIPSKYSSIECMKKLLIFLKNDVTTIHPSGLLGRLQVMGPVSVGPDTVISHTKENGVKKEVEYKVRRGMLTQSDATLMSMCHAITSDLIVSCVSTTKNGDHSVIDKDEPRTGIKSLNLINAKHIWGDTEKNPVACRNLIFSRMMQPENALPAIRTHSNCGETFPHYRIHEELSKVVVKAEQDECIAKGRPAIKQAPVKVCEYDRSNSKCVNDLPTVWLQFNGRQAITGDTDPSKVYCGYFRFSMSAADSKTLATVQDILMVAREYKVDKIALYNKSDLGVSVINALIANKIYIMCKNLVGEKFVDGVPGVYSYDHKLSDQCAHFFNYAINDFYPKITGKGIEHKTQLFKSLVEYVCDVKRPAKFFFYAVLNESLVGIAGYSMYPCVAAERMRMLMLRNAPSEFKFSTLVRRASVANYCKLNFPISRKPFWYVDSCREVLGYNRYIILPKSVPSKEVVEKYRLEVDEEEDVTVGPQFEQEFSQLKIPKLIDVAERSVPPLMILANVSEDKFVELATRYQHMLQTGQLAAGDDEFAFLIKQCGDSIPGVHSVLQTISTNQKPFARWFANIMGMREKEEPEREEDTPAHFTNSAVGGIGTNNDNIVSEALNAFKVGEDDMGEFDPEEAEVPLIGDN